MAFSMHSHSGQFCPGHAQDQLELIIETAIARGMQTFALTEHMPRVGTEDLYPEEDSLDALMPRHAEYIVEAVRLRQIFNGKIKILIGFEAEWIRPEYEKIVKDLASHPDVDFFIGSVHHMFGIPIDYDAKFYHQAREVAGGTDESLFEAYFDMQYGMLQALQPRVVGHFDLIRLLSDDPNRELREMKGVWERILRNLKLIVDQGGLMEVNTSALRKGLQEPYPTKSVCQEFLKIGGKLTMSDDSHGIGQVGTNYVRAMEYLHQLGVEELFLLESVPRATSGERRTVRVQRESLRSIKASFK